MIAPEGQHKRTAEAMRQDSAEITPEQIEYARKLVAKYPSIVPTHRPRLHKVLSVANQVLIATALAALLLHWLTA